MSSSVRKVRCPTCVGMSVYSAENAFRPFCSERCKLMDLGAWANGDYAIAGNSLEIPLTDGDGAQPFAPESTLRH